MQMSIRNHDMLALLQDHAGRFGDDLAHVLPDRDITYRRLWSRIERGSARLCGEWHVRAGDVVAYVGRGHPDAIVLYFALLRIGATLLPLEAMSAAQVTQVLAAYQPTLVIKDHAGADQLASDHRVHPLHELLASWSHHAPALVDQTVSARALWLPDPDLEFQAYSLEQLCDSLPATSRKTFIDQKIFTADVLREVVLPSLRDHRLMQFAATDPISDTGS
ncbi:MAG: hypothetical protein RL083_1070 [Pseudomonadota bacterium]|jgi:acyl-coenzyme A synthetase/AMP-(fatty) acid ligase